MIWIQLKVSGQGFASLIKTYYAFGCARAIVVVVVVVVIVIIIFYWRYIYMHQLPPKGTAKAV